MVSGCFLLFQYGGNTLFCQLVFLGISCAGPAPGSAGDGWAGGPGEGASVDPLEPANFSPLIPKPLQHIIKSVWPLPHNSHSFHAFTCVMPSVRSGPIWTRPPSMLSARLRFGWQRIGRRWDYQRKRLSDLKVRTPLRTPQVQSSSRNSRPPDTGTLASATGGLPSTAEMRSGAAWPR
jgi:hypothetical protein